MFGNVKWSNIRIGGKYAVIFLFITISFLIAIFITGIFINRTSGDMDETVKRNHVSTYSSDLVALFDEKYLLIPEYILMSDNGKLNEYLDRSKQFVTTAKKLKKDLDKDQLATFNKLIENNNKLDEYFFSNDSKAFSYLSRTCSFNGGVQGQQVRLICDRFDNMNNFCNRMGLAF